MLTEAAVIAAIRELRRELGCSPSYREIGRKLSVSHMTAFRFVLKLRKSGKVKCLPWCGRSIRVV